VSSTSIDFLHSRRANWLGWMMFVIGAITLALSAGLHRHWSTQRSHRNAVILAQQQVAGNAQRAALRPVPPSPEQRRFQHIAPQLRQPWLPTLRLIENVTEPPVFLLALSVDPAAGSLRIEGETSTFDQVLSYLQTLDEPGLLGPAELRSHEQTLDPSGHTVVRFSIVTKWRAQ